MGATESRDCSLLCDCSAEQDGLRRSTPLKEGMMSVPPRVAGAPTVPLGMQPPQNAGSPTADRKSSVTPTLVGSKAPTNGILRQSPRRQAYATASPVKSVQGLPTPKTPPASLPSHYRNSPEMRHHDRSPSVPVLMHSSSSPTIPLTTHQHIPALQSYSQPMYLQTSLYSSMPVAGAPPAGLQSFTSHPHQPTSLFNSAPTAPQPMQFSPSTMMSYSSSPPPSTSLTPLAGSSWFPSTSPMHRLSPQANSFHYVLQPTSVGSSTQLQQQLVPGIPYHQAGLRL